MEFQSLKLAQTAKKVVEVCAAVKEGEQVCVVTDTNKLSIAQALAQACAAVGAETVVCIMAPRKMHGNELPPVVAAAMKAAQCIIAPTTYAPTHTDATKEALKAGARMFILREVTEETFTEGAATADYEEIYQVTSALAQRLSHASQVRMVTARGTDITLSVEGRQALCLAGMLRGAQRFGGLPSGETAIVPVEGTATGKLVIDHAIDGIGLLSQPVTLTLRKGSIAKIEGGPQAGQLEAVVQGAGKSGRNVAEFAIGTNPLSRMKGNVAEDKILRGAVHIGIGDSHLIGGKVSSSIHLDMVVLRPTVWLDGQEIVKDGSLIL